MGAIYEVEGPGGLRLALKTVLFDGLGISSDPDLLERFRREGELLGRLDHPKAVAPPWHLDIFSGIRGNLQKNTAIWPTLVGLTG